jgi:hypothetical protein
LGRALDIARRNFSEEIHQHEAEGETFEGNGPPRGAAGFVASMLQGLADTRKNSLIHNENRCNIRNMKKARLSKPSH